MANPAAALRQAAQARWPGATVAGRGRNWLRHQHPTDPTRHMLDVSVGPLHVVGTETEIDTAWQPVTGTWQYQTLSADYVAKAKAAFNGAPLVEYRVGTEYVTLQPRALEWTNDRNDVQTAGGVQAASAIAQDDLLRWTDAYGAGRHFEWFAHGGRLSKAVLLDSYASLPAPSAQVLGGANPVLRAGFQLSYADTLTVYVDGVAWTGNQRPTRDTAGVIEFRRSDGSVAFAFGSPVAGDRSAGRFPAGGVVQRLSKSGPNLFVEVRVPQPWLAGAAYPVVIDPTLDVTVSASANDGRWFVSPNSFFSATDTSITFPWATSDFTDGNLWARFTGISGLSGATINVSYLTLHAADTSSGTASTTVSAVDQAAPAAPTSSADAEGKTRTTASVSWSLPAFTAGTSYNSPSLNTVIQELASSFDPTVIMIYVEDASTTDTGARHVTAYDGSTTNAPKLHLEYTAGGGGGGLSMPVAMHNYRRRRVA